MSSEHSRHSNKFVSTPPAVDDRTQFSGRHERPMQHAQAQIEKALRGLRFGQVTITVQDGVVVQIDRLERTRLQRSSE